MESLPLKLLRHAHSPTTSQMSLFKTWIWSCLWLYSHQVQQSRVSFPLPWMESRVKAVMCGRRYATFLPASLIMLVLLKITTMSSLGAIKSLQGQVHKDARLEN